MIQRIGETPLSRQKYTLRPGAYVAIVSEGQVLLTHQQEPVPEFQLPGGGVDPGEQVLPALHREVLEETGWTITGPRRLGAFRRFTYMPEYDLWAEKLCTIYGARQGLRRGPPTEAGHSAIWMRAADAVRLLANDGDRLFLARALGLGL